MCCIQSPVIKKCKEGYMEHQQKKVCLACFNGTTSSLLGEQHGVAGQSSRIDFERS